MNRGLLDAPVLYQRHLGRSTTILAVIVGLIAFYPLIGCASLEGATGTRTTATTTSSHQTSPWTLVWHDEFSKPAGTPPDPSKWTPDTGGNGWGDKQLEYNTDNQNVYQDGRGNLILEARKGNPEGLQCWYGSCQYTSARITTSGHFTFTYGLIEARIKIPYGQGLWPAFWLLGNNCDTVGWPTCGEIDIMETTGRELATNHGSVHGPESFTGPYPLPHGTFADDFHIFALQWDPNYLYFFVDGIRYFTLDKATLTKQQDWVYNHPFEIILDVAVGGENPGNPDATTVFPQKMYVSYVRVYRHE